MSDHTPAEHARAAADAVRELNHATLNDGDNWEFPPDAYDVIGGLDRMAGGLPQALRQVEALLTRVHATGSLRSTGDADEDLPAARDALSEAAAAAQQLAEALGRAHSATSRLYTDG